jgi:hypothetical protein
MAENEGRFLPLNTSFRLFGSLALAAVTASIVNAQAYGSSSSSVLVNMFAINGSYTTSSYSYSTIQGPYDSGNASAYDFTFSNAYKHGSYGSGAYGAAVALNGEAFEFAEEYDFINFSNPHNFTIEIGLGISTSSYSYASQTATGDWAYGAGSSQIYFDNHRLEESATAAEVDNPYSVGSFIQEYSYSSNSGYSFHSAYYGFASPFHDQAFASDYDTFIVEVAPYSIGTLRLFTQANEGAVSVPSRSSTPSPIAVTPFAAGLLGVMRRRRRR